MIVAGELVPDPAGAVALYLADHYDTVAHFDLYEGDRRAVDHSLIKATRSPWMNSRISMREADWFINQSNSAPWSAVPIEAELVDADPTQRGSLYDKAGHLYGHFFADRPPGIAVAKISKVLHVCRPRFFPILDRRLLRIYRFQAIVAARRIGPLRPEFAHFRRLDWEAIRSDIVANRAALAELRRALNQSSAPHAGEVADQVGDVRLLDMIAWKRG